MYPYGDELTITHREPTGQDGDGNDTFTTTTTTVVGGFAPSISRAVRSHEMLGGRDTVITETLAFFPPGTVVDSNDAVTVRGETYEVTGDAQDWRNPFTGWRAGVVVVLRKVTG